MHIRDLPNRIIRCWDNLKLGYGGTKTEMERLIADANKVKEANGEMADLSIDSFADVTEAIHIIQERNGDYRNDSKRSCIYDRGFWKFGKSCMG